MSDIIVSRCARHWNLIFSSPEFWSPKDWQFIIIKSYLFSSLINHFVSHRRYSTILRDRRKGSNPNTNFQNSRPHVSSNHILVYYYTFLEFFSTPSSMLPFYSLEYPKYQLKGIHQNPSHRKKAQSSRIFWRNHHLDSTQNFRASPKMSTITDAQWILKTLLDLPESERTAEILKLGWSYNVKHRQIDVYHPS